MFRSYRINHRVVLYIYYIYIHIYIYIYSIYLWYDPTQHRWKKLADIGGLIAVKSDYNDIEDKSSWELVKKVSLDVSSYYVLLIRIGPNKVEI